MPSHWAEIASVYWWYPIIDRQTDDLLEIFTRGPTSCERLDSGDETSALFHPIGIVNAGVLRYKVTSKTFGFAFSLKSRFVV